MKENSLAEITKSALLGQAVGDAFGVPVEFLSREEVRALHLHDMVGKGCDLVAHTRWGDSIPKGSWSDDTSMTVASMASFIKNGGKIDHEDQMCQFLNWWHRDEYCCLPYAFGLGGNISAALDRFQAKCPALKCGGRGFMDNGNGALMRILPFSLYCIFHGLDAGETAAVVSDGSAITHGHDISKMCCFIWTEFLRSLSEGGDADTAIDHIEGLALRQWFSDEAVNEVRIIADGKTRLMTEDNICQTGYVVDTLYSALFSMYHADSFESAIMNAVNLGYDTDTAGAVTGTAAGLRYGMDDIPERWLNVLGRRDYLEGVAADFSACFQSH